ncbi:bifunctional aspartate transaminase/aspartate 4-decarboxylase, partial [Streptomyces goshikiensis]
MAHKLTTLRDKRTDSPTFRRLADELVTLLAYEATRDVRTEQADIETPVGPTTGVKLSHPRPLVVPILRAGLGMLDGMVRLLPTAEVGFLGMVRNEETLEASTYATRMPEDLSGRQVYVVDPMLATGGTLVAAIQELIKRGADDVTAVVLLAAPEGVEVMERELAGTPVTVVTAAVDERLNELKDTFIRLAQEAQAGEPGQKETTVRAMLNAGRGNPNWTATGPREAFHALGYFALDESRRVWTADNLGGMPERRGIGERFDSWVRRHPQLPGVELLTACVQYALARWAFDKDGFVHELADAVIGDNYPEPGRMLTHAEHIVRGYLGFEMFGPRPPKGDMSLFATEGGTAAMCYVFDSLVENGILRKGDKIALMTPVFAPYVEIPELDAYEFEVVEVRASLSAETGVRQWHHPREEVAKLADPAVRLVCVVNPGNPPSLALDDRVAEQIREIVATANPRLLIVTDDVYGTFVPGFRSLAADVPRNTLLVYSYSKHFGCTGWRLGVIGLHDDNVVDEMIADLPQERKDHLARRYRALTPEPEKLRFIDRLVADSRSVALRHTAGLSLPQQAMMVLFSLFDLLEEGQAYKEQVREVVR